MAGKAKGSTKSKGARAKAPVPDRLPPATQAEIIALDPDKGVDRIPVLEPTSNVPSITAADLLAGGDKNAQQSLKDQKKALDAARERQEEAAKARAQAVEDQYKDKEKRAVNVIALRKGFYPHDGRLRHPGEAFVYHLERDKKTGKVETEIPSWMQHADGKIPTRDTPDEIAAQTPEPIAPAPATSATRSSVI